MKKLWRAFLWLVLLPSRTLRRIALWWLGLSNVFADQSAEWSALSRLQSRVRRLEVGARPYVLLRGAVVLELDEKIGIDSCWCLAQDPAERAEFYSPGHRLTLRMCAMQPLRVKSLELLAGPWEISDVRVGHSSMLFDAVVPPGVVQMIPQGLREVNVGSAISVDVVFRGGEG